MQFRSLENNVGNDTGAVASRYDNILFNLVNKAVELDGSNIVLQVNFGLVYAQSTSDWGLSLGDDTLFNLNSDNAKFSFERLYIGTRGGRAFTVGAGKGGELSIGDLYINAYGARSEGQSAIYIDTGAKVKIGTYTIKKPQHPVLIFQEMAQALWSLVQKELKYFSPYLMRFR